jgi:thermostable 8-oxoguanine DNA glycosylase
MVRGRSVRYRFAAQKAKYLAGSLAILAAGAPTVSTGRSLRDWLLQLPGVGFKTASWVARNWLDADDVAILDVHILRVGYAIGLFSPRLTVTRDYLKLEERFLALAQAMRVRPSQLDAVIWHEMASSPRTVQAMTSQHHSALPQPDHRQTNSPQAVLAV